MCGIAGIVSVLGPEADAAVARMQEALVHRGPDGEGRWAGAPDGDGWGVTLGHRRLAVLDLGPAASQPIVDPDSGTALAMNGEIYNFKALRTRLPHRRFESTGDTEPMLATLVEAGDGGWAQLRGMFAAACWRPDRRELTLARDPHGIKPLYIARNPDPHGWWSVAFASEIRALLSSGLIDARLDRLGVASMLWNGFVVGPHTAVAGVEELRAGEALVLDGRGGIRRRFDHGRAVDTELEPVDSLSRALSDSVELHLASDVPLGVFLSAGVDSASIANTAVRVARHPVHTFTMAFEEAALSEGPTAGRIAAALGTEHHEVVLTERAFVDGLPDAIAALDQPAFDGVNSYYLSRAVRDAGFTVALAGTGGDELFGGYRSFADLPKLARYGRLASRPMGLVEPAFGRRRTGLLGRQSRWAKLPGMLARADDLVRLYQLAYALFQPSFHRQLLLDRPSRDEMVDGLPAGTADRLRRELLGRTPLDAISHLEQSLFLGARLLRDTDVVSMATSLEVRLPLVDAHLTAHVTGMSDEERFMPVGRKQALRTVGLAGLDPALFTGPKSGFVLPFDSWLRRTLGSVVDQTLMDRTLVASAGLDPQAVQRLWTTYQQAPGRIYWTRIWAVYALVSWTARTGVRV